MMYLYRAASGPRKTTCSYVASCPEGLVTIAVEGKVSESFDLPDRRAFRCHNPGQIERGSFLKRNCWAYQNRLIISVINYFTRTASAW